MVEVLFDRELPDLASPGTRAFEVKAKGSLFAMICDHSYYPRYNVYQELRRANVRNLLTPLDVFSIDVPYDKTSKKVCFIFNKPTAQRLSPNQQVNLKSLRGIIIPRICDTLEELNSLNISHRAIRGDNIFFNESDKSFMLNECVTSPPGMFQPAVYEEINRQLCVPFLRGEGTTATDLYALGILIVNLVSGKEPFQKLSNQQIAEKKFEHGSFFALVAESNLVSYDLKEILQGLLQDEKKLRWEVKDLKEWVSGVIKIRNFVRRNFKTTPIVLVDTKISSVIQFLLFVINNWKSLSTKLDIKRIKDWIVKNFSDKTLVEKIDNIIYIRKMHLSSISFSELALIAICFAITGEGPLVWRKWVFMPDSISQLLLYCFFEEDSVDVLKELVRTKVLSGIASFFNFPEKDSYEILEHEISYNFNGLEYCLYRFNNGIPCMSPIIFSQVAFNIKDILPALERNVKSIKKYEIIDSHILTFINKILKNSSSSNYGFQNLKDIEEQIKVLMSIENVNGKVIPHQELSKIIINYSKGFINEYKNKDTKEKLQKLIDDPDTINMSFKEIYNMINNVQLLRKDIDEFKIAKKKYKDICMNIARISAIYLNRHSISSYFADKITLSLCMFIAIFILIIILNVFVGGR